MMSWRSLAFSGALLASAGVPHANAAIFSIATPQFSAFVDPRTYTPLNPAQNGSISRKDLTRGLLYFSVTIVGDERAFQHADHHRELGLEAAIWCDGRDTGSVQFGMSTRDWEFIQNALRAELDQKGVFTWRTYINTKRIACSKIEIIMRDDNDDVVTPVGSHGTFNATVEITP